MPDHLLPLMNTEVMADVVCVCDSILYKVHQVKFKLTWDLKFLDRPPSRKKIPPGNFLVKGYARGILPSGMLRLTGMCRRMGCNFTIGLPAIGEAFLSLL